MLIARSDRASGINKKDVLEIQNGTEKALRPHQDTSSGPLAPPVAWSVPHLAVHVGRALDPPVVSS
jgi:hypothetical protein